MNIKYSIKNYLNLFTHTAFGMSLVVWVKLLAKNSFAIDIRFLPKIIFITGNIIINIPFQIFEYIRYNKKIVNTNVQRPVFIIGHPRSGTTYLQYVLSKDPQFSYCSTYEALIPHLFLSMGKLTKNILSLAMPDTRPQDNVKAGVDKPKEEEFAIGNMCNTSLVHGFYFPKNIQKTFDEAVIFEKGDPELLSNWKKHFDYFIKKITYKYTGKRMLLKSPSNTGRVKEILELYPDACFIHIHRDPYAVFRSNVKLYEKILPLLGFQKVKNETIENYIFYSYEKMYKKYLKDKLIIPDKQLIELSYTDFVSNPLQELKIAYDYLGLGDFDKAKPYLQEEIKSVENYEKNTYVALDEKLRNRVAEKWAFFFDAYGYNKNS